MLLVDCLHDGVHYSTLTKVEFYKLWGVISEAYLVKNSLALHRLLGQLYSLKHPFFVEDKSNHDYSLYIHGTYEQDQINLLMISCGAILLYGDFYENINTMFTNTRSLPRKKLIIDMSSTQVIKWLLLTLTNNTYTKTDNRYSIPDQYGGLDNVLDKYRTKFLLIILTKMVIDNRNHNYSSEFIKSALESSLFSKQDIYNFQSNIDTIVKEVNKIVYDLRLDFIEDISPDKRIELTIASDQISKLKNYCEVLQGNKT